MHKRRYKGFDYEAREPNPSTEPEPNQDVPGTPGTWVHKGGGYYENTVTGERRRGKPGAQETSHRGR